MRKNIVLLVAMVFCMSASASFAADPGATPMSPTDLLAGTTAEVSRSNKDDSVSVPATPGSFPSAVQSQGKTPTPEAPDASTIAINPAKPGSLQMTPEELAFKQASQGLMPLTPEMIQKFKKDFGSVQNVLAAPLSPAAKPVSRSMSLTLKPGEEPPALRLSAGNATTVTFSDITGSPWPVMSVTVGNPAAYQASEAGEKGKTNIIVISPLTNFQQSNNLVVTLKDHPVPIVFAMETGVNEVDYRVDVSLRLRGPNAIFDMVMQTSLPATNDAMVQSFLDGVPPKDAISIPTSNSMVEAWKMGDSLYLRTSFEVMSPTYVARARNVSGVNVYTLTETPIVLVSQGGRLSSVQIGF